MRISRGKRVCHSVSDSDESDEARKHVRKRAQTLALVSAPVPPAHPTPTSSATQPEIMFDTIFVRQPSEPNSNHVIGIEDCNTDGASSSTRSAGRVQRTNRLRANRLGSLPSTNNAGITQGVRANHRRSASMDGANPRPGSDTSILARTDTTEQISSSFTTSSTSTSVPPVRRVPSSTLLGVNISEHAYHPGGSARTTGGFATNGDGTLAPATLLRSDVPGRNPERACKKETLFMGDETSQIERQLPLSRMKLLSKGKNDMPPFEATSTALPVSKAKRISKGKAIATGAAETPMEVPGSNQKKVSKGKTSLGLPADNSTLLPESKPKMVSKGKAPMELSAHNSADLPDAKPRKISKGKALLAAAARTTSALPPPEILEPGPSKSVKISNSKRVDISPEQVRALMREEFYKFMDLKHASIDDLMYQLLAKKAKEMIESHSLVLPEGLDEEEYCLRMATDISDNIFKYPERSLREQKEAWRRIFNNLKANKQLFNDVMWGVIDPVSLTKMTSEELAKPELRAQNEKWRAESVREATVINKEPEYRLRKTHKGEELVHNLNYNRPSQQPKVSVPKPAWYTAPPEDEEEEEVDLWNYYPPAPAVVPVSVKPTSQTTGAAGPPAANKIFHPGPSSRPRKPTPIPRLGFLEGTEDIWDLIEPGHNLGKDPDQKQPLHQ